MRITDSYRFTNSQSAIQNALGRLNDVQRQVSTGKRINQPSDAPLDAALATRLRMAKDDGALHLRSLQDSKAWLSVQDASLQSASTLMTRAQELSLQVQNPSLGEGGRDAIATELDGIRDQIALVANTTYQGQSVFGAFGEKAVTVTDTDATFNGTPGARVERRVSDSQMIAVNTDGNVVFGFDTGDDIFGVIARLAANVRSGDDAALASDAAALAERATTVRDSLGEVGTRAALVDSAASRHEDDKITIASRISEVEDADITESAVKLAQASQGYEAVLAMVSMTQQRSLLDFLR
jgi:flagellar hook-associated protein 3 FlgL